MVVLVVLVVVVVAAAVVVVDSVGVVSQAVVAVTGAKKNSALSWVRSGAVVVVVSAAVDVVEVAVVVGLDFSSEPQPTVPSTRPAARAITLIDRCGVRMVDKIRFAGCPR